MLQGMLEAELNALSYNRLDQIRYCTKFISYKDLKLLLKDLKLVYKADTEEVAPTALDELEAT